MERRQTVEIPSDLQDRLCALAQQTGEDAGVLVRRLLESQLPLPGQPMGSSPVQAAAEGQSILVTLQLMQHIENTIAAERSAFAEGMAAQDPASGAGWLAVAGGRAIFTGVGFFSNRAMAVGLHGPVSHEDMDRIETFYAVRGIQTEIELSAMVDRSLIRLLSQRGYRLVRLRNIYARSLGCWHGSGSQAVAIHAVEAANASDWSMTLLDGFEYTQDADRTRVMRWNEMLLSLPGMTALVAVLDGQPVGAASVMCLGTTAMLGGAATRPAFRRCGVQRALIEARLALAARAGCELAIVTADPGGSSGRNAERVGFQLICNHIAMRAPGEVG